ncbi:MAG TPA: hypothetical protein V6D17_09975 [Candidatus Obscuribacterales bacterium]
MSSPGICNIAAGGISPTDKRNIAATSVPPNGASHSAATSVPPNGASHSAAANVPPAETPDSAGANGTDSKVMPTGSGSLSAETIEITKILGFYDDLQRFEALRSTEKKSDADRLEFLTAKQDLIDAALAVAFEVRNFVHTLDRDVAQADTMAAYLAQKRDKAIRLNSYANLISGGITGVISGGLQLGEVNHLADDTIDTVEGVVQCGLALLALRQQRGEHRLERSIPNVLSWLVNPAPEMMSVYPRGVWTYLNAPSADGPPNVTRREVLLNKWVSSGWCIVNPRKRQQSELRAARITGTHKADFKVTSDLLEDRIAMLMELRSTVTKIDRNLMELFQYVRFASRPTR